MRPTYHIAVSTGISIGVYGFTQSLWASAVQWVAGVLIDLDHPLEYWIKRKRNRSLKDFLYMSMSDTFKTVHLLFHGWEIVLLTGILAFFYIGPLIGIALCIGLTQHLMFDQFTNPTHRYSYFLLYRIINKFETKICFPKRT